MLTCTKMNGNGNDFLIIDNMDLRLSSEQLFDIAPKICRRREAIGADGILVAEPSDKADFKMRLVNSDGTEGEMCGNGSRCIARFAYENGIAKNSEMTFETLGGMVNASVRGCRAALKLFPVSVKDVPLDKPASINGFNFNYTFLNVGVPHTVIFEKEHRTEEEYRKLGKEIRWMTDLFPEGTNVNFAVPREEPNGGLDVVTFERGVEDLTLSCGTGSTASAIAGLLIGLTGPKVEVHNPGGVNSVSLTFQSADAILPELEGVAVRVAEVQITDEVLK